MSINEILHRLQMEKQIKKQIKKMDKKDNTIKHCFYINGPVGVGKTEFVRHLLRGMKYKYIYHSCIGLKHTFLLNTIEENRFQLRTMETFFNKKKSNVFAVIIDDIHYSNTQDKKYLLQIIDLLKKRKKKTPLYVPFFFIGNVDVNKQLKALLQIADEYTLQKPLQYQIKQILQLDKIDDVTNKDLTYIDGNLHNLETYKQMKKCNLSYSSLFSHDQGKYKINTITNVLLNQGIERQQYNKIVEESTKTSIGLMYHENIAEYIKYMYIPFYMRMLNHYIYSDYIDRIIFQKQLWILNDNSCMMKSWETTLYYDDYNIQFKATKPIRFTQILTKYASEYNNFCFIRTICDILQLDFRDIYHMLQIKNHDYFYHHGLTKLQVDRLYKLYGNIYNIEMNTSNKVTIEKNKDIALVS